MQILRCPCPQAGTFGCNQCDLTDHHDSLTGTGIYVVARDPGDHIACRRAAAGIAEHVEVTEGEKGLPKVVLRHSCGAKAEVCCCIDAQAAHSLPTCTHACMHACGVTSSRNARHHP